MKAAGAWFLEFAALGPIPHGREDEVYGGLLAEMGFTRVPGAYVLRPEAPVVLAAHLDTVQGKKPREVRVEGHIAYGVGGALGADDKAGVALVLWLASLGEEGPRDVGYALFLGEEVGCVGASEALEAGLFRGAKAMISLDRKGTRDVVVAQLGQETASREAGLWLAKELGMGHTLVEGVWTDSAVFAGVVPECLNLSVGYEGAHTDWDQQDLAYLDELAHRLLAVRWRDLPVVRTPREVWRKRGGAGYYDPWWAEAPLEEAPEWSTEFRAFELVDRLKREGLLEEALELLLMEFPELLDYLEKVLGEDFAER